MFYIMLGSIIANVIMVIFLIWGHSKGSKNRDHSISDVNDKLAKLSEDVESMLIRSVQTKDVAVYDKITAMCSTMDQYKKDLEELPKRTLKSIQASTSYHQGVVGEQMAYMQLKAEYDRVIPLGNVADFLCIRFGNGDRKGTIQLVDIKTGGAVLSEDQQKLKGLLEKGNIGFYVLNIQRDEVVGYKNAS